jgi:hypothetical protein
MHTVKNVSGMAFMGAYETVRVLFRETDSCPYNQCIDVIRVAQLRTQYGNESRRPAQGSRGAGQGYR